MFSQLRAARTQVWISVATYGTETIDQLIIDPSRPCSNRPRCRRCTFTLNNDNEIVELSKHRRIEYDFDFFSKKKGPRATWCKVGYRDGPRSG
jgi:hypothetical protein